MSGWQRGAAAMRRGARAAREGRPHVMVTVSLLDGEGANWGDVAALFRATAHTRRLAERLLSEGKVSVSQRAQANWRLEWRLYRENAPDVCIGAVRALVGDIMLLGIEAARFLLRGGDVSRAFTAAAARCVHDRH